MGTVDANKENQYKCGKCGKRVYYSIFSSPPDCPECGWEFLTDSQYDVPTPTYPI